MSARPAPLVLIVGDIEEHAKALVHVLSRAPADVVGARRWSAIGFDKAGQQGVDAHIAAVFASQPLDLLTYIIVAELLPDRWLSSEVQRLIAAKPYASLIGWAETPDCLPLLCHGLTCHTRPEFQGTPEEGARIWEHMTRERDARVHLQLHYKPLRVSMVTGMADVGCPSPVTKEWVEHIGGAKLKGHNTVAWTANVTQVSRHLKGVSLEDDPLPYLRTNRTPPATLGMHVVVAVAWMRAKDLRQYDAAVTWLTRMRSLAPCLLVVLMDEASVHGFEATVAGRARRQNIELCYGTAETLQVTGPSALRRLLTTTALGLGAEARLPPSTGS
jgi:hypothetical protein